MQTNLVTVTSSAGRAIEFLFVWILEVRDCSRAVHVYKLGQPSQMTVHAWACTGTLLTLRPEPPLLDAHGRSAQGRVRQKGNRTWSRYTCTTYRTRYQSTESGTPLLYAITAPGLVYSGAPCTFGSPTLLNIGYSQLRFRILGSSSPSVAQEITPMDPV